ncbi:MAG: helix-turn-helix domain-containing protein [Pseudomonadota bacterium]
MRGYTRTGAFGPIADFVDLHGGSIRRVFDDVDLPMAVLDNPDLPLPLVEQYRVLSAAGQEIGDPYVGANLGRLVSLQHLGPYGAWMCAAPTLATLIDRCEHSIGCYLQTANRIQLRVHESGAQFSIEFLDDRSEAWLQNELLGVSYLIECIRQFAGGSWSPDLIRSTCTGAESAAELEKIFEAPVWHGADVSVIQFAPGLLATTKVCNWPAQSDDEPILPIPQSRRDDVTALIAIALLERQPKIDWVASRLSTSRRSLQRTLDTEGCNFSGVLESLLMDRATELLRSTDRTITDVALELGYSDSAHFTRAFRKWTGVSPSRFRQSEQSPQLSAFVPIDIVGTSLDECQLHPNIRPTRFAIVPYGKALQWQYAARFM